MTDGPDELVTTTGGIRYSVSDNDERLWARGSWQPADLGREHPRVFRRRDDVLAREREPRREARVACYQPDPARIRRERSAPLAAGDASARSPTRSVASWTISRSSVRCCSATRWAAPWRSGSPTPIPIVSSGSSTATAQRLLSGSTGTARSSRSSRRYCRGRRISIDLTLSVVFDSPDLLIGRRLSSTMRGLWPDAQQNLVRSARSCLSARCSCLSTCATRSDGCRENGIPILAEWGCFDRVVTARTAQGVLRADRARQVVWVPGRSLLDAPEAAGAGRHPAAPRGRSPVSCSGLRQKRRLGRALGRSSLVDWPALSNRRRLFDWRRYVGSHR